MSDRFQILPGVINPIEQTGRQRGKTTASKPTGKAFAEILDQQIKPLQFSHHARQRMESRGIVLSGDEMNRLDQAVASVKAKGGRDSLVLLGDNALVVSVKNQTVVTVVDRSSLKGNVFTNIDSAIIA